MSKHLLLALCFTLSGCMIYAPTYNSQETVIHYTASAVDDHSTVTTTTNAVKKRVHPSKPLSSAQRPLAECGPYDLPRAEPMPPAPTEAELEAANTAEEIDKLVGAYAKALRTHIISERRKIEQAHEEWLRHCRQK